MAKEDNMNSKYNIVATWLNDMASEMEEAILNGYAKSHEEYVLWCDTVEYARSMARKIEYREETKEDKVLNNFEEE